jgi:hypothetical protein
MFSPAQIDRFILMEVSQKLLIQKSGWFIRKHQPFFTLDGLFVSTKKFSTLCSPYPFQGSILVGALLTFVQHDNCPAFLYHRLLLFEIAVPQGFIKKSWPSSKMMISSSVVASFFQVEASRLQFGSRGSGRWGFRKNT